MSKLKLSAILDDRPVKIAVELRGAVHRDLVAYAELLWQRDRTDPRRRAKQIAPMLARFLLTDRAFATARPTLKPGDCSGHAGRMTVSTNTDRAGKR